VTSKFTKSALRDLKRLEKADATAVLTAIDRLCASGHGDVVKMHATAVPTWRLRVGTFRVIYTRDRQTIWIERIGDRREVYRS